jgi:hypothetical protein
MPVTRTEGKFTVLPVKQRARGNHAVKARRWALRLSKRVAEVLAAHPNANPDNVRHTLILLEMPPVERLQRSLIRGRVILIQSPQSTRRF